MNEVKRLYGRRDGVEPPKVHLTRGALVRMYARTKLIPQAIAEARAALEEDPNRIDLQLILARMYHLSGQNVEASEICTKILSRLPYCLEANWILMDILRKTSRSEEAKNLIERVNALDPYNAFISQNTPTSDLVPDDAIMLEHLENARAAAGQVFTSAGEFNTPESEVDWLKSFSPEQNTENQTSKEPKTEIPEWMQSAGWTPADTTTPEPPPLPITETPEAETDGQALPAEIPDWLKDLQGPAAEEPTQKEPREAAP